MWTWSNMIVILYILGFRIFGEGQGGKKSELVLFNLLLFYRADPFLHDLQSTAHWLKWGRVDRSYPCLHLHHDSQSHQCYSWRCMAQPASRWKAGVHCRSKNYGTRKETSAPRLLEEETLKFSWILRNIIKLEIMSWWFGKPELLQNISDCSICTFVIHTLNYTWHKVSSNFFGRNAAVFYLCVVKYATCPYGHFMHILQ